VTLPILRLLPVVHVQGDLQIDPHSPILSLGYHFQMIPSPKSVVTPDHRGAFIVLEGVDRCGKTTQCGLLLKHLLSLGLSALAIRFPDRTTSVGTLINSYLQSSQNLDDRAIHLLFSANRWEAVPSMTRTLAAGTTLICDRYAHSGVAFSSGKDSGLTMDWCKGPDLGLPAPDAVIFLNLSQEESEKRGGYVGVSSKCERLFQYP
jgi:dTMP kinase